MYPKSELKEKGARIEEARNHGPKTRTQKRKEAEKRNKKWQSLSISEQLAFLDQYDVYGKKTNARRQRARIAEKLEHGKK